MVIDEEKEFGLFNYAQMKKNKKVIATDHNGEILDLNINFNMKMAPREEMFNFKNTMCQKAFKEETEKNLEILSVFENDLPFEVQSKKWLKVFNSILHKCFKKVRIVKKKKEVDKCKELLGEKRKLQKDTKMQKLNCNG